MLRILQACKVYTKTDEVYYWAGIYDKGHTVPYEFCFPSYTVNTLNQS